ncbi:pentapeptide repeat-containing protein [Acerihabitans arboris]|uniref:E3 ubiquitin ligase SopA-like central domain-containing protein n=1 Tax=Acerihabitans arboris TaxID=2691583 RepID=A0A845SMU6_9GAMM|nr:pentapeptide repeat-containing protein [Acerihabitans arboris]NDL63941.1 hypothetical protein [Acerihabitans arboris]
MGIISSTSEIVQYIWSYGSKAPLPQEIIGEHISNLFSPCIEQKKLTWQNDLFTQALADALSRESTDKNPYGIPAKLNVDFNGWVVTAIRPGENHDETGPVTIEIRKDRQSHEVHEVTVDKDMFFLGCNVLMLRRRFDLDSSPGIFTDWGKMNMIKAALPEADLRGCTLRQADLRQANLAEANLTGVDLQNAYLCEADLTKANLSGANLRKASLEKADLREANLSDADLTNASLWGTVLSGADLRRATLRDVCLYQIDVGRGGSEMQWGKPNLSGANLSEAYLKDIHLSKADLRGSVLIKADLRGAKLENADLRDADLGGAKLSRVKLRGAKLTGADLRGTDLSYVDLRNVDLTEAKMGENDLNGAQLGGVDLNNLPKQGALLKLPHWNTTLLDRYLNDASGTVLTMMDSIDERHADVKLRMARELVASLQNADVSSVALPLLATLSKAPYLSDARIDTWLDTVCELYLSQYEGKVLPPLDVEMQNQVTVLLRLLKMFSHQPDRMFSHNGAFNQLVTRGIEADDEIVNGSAARLYRLYLSNEKVKPYAALNSFGIDGTRQDGLTG